MTDSRKVDRLSSVAFYAVVLLLLWLVFRIVSPFLVALGWAAIVAILINPLHDWLSVRWGAGRAALASTLGVMFALVGPGAFLGFYFVREGVQAVQTIQELAAAGRLDWVARFWDSAAQRLGMSNVSFTMVLQDAAGNVASFLAGSFGGLVANIVRVILDILIMLFGLFFFLRDRDSIMAVVRRLLPFEEPLRERMLAEVQQLIHASVTVSLVIAIVQGSVCGFAFAVVGIGGPVFWGLVMSFMSLLPVIGAWPIWVPAVIWLFVTGSLGNAIILLVLCGGIAGTADNFLRPALMSGRSSLGGLSVFISVLGGIAAFGMIGLVLGPIVFATVSALLFAYTRPVQPAA